MKSAELAACKACLCLSLRCRCTILLLVLFLLLLLLLLLVLLLLLFLLLLFFLLPLLLLFLLFLLLLLLVDLGITASSFSAFRCESSANRAVTLIPSDSYNRPGRSCSRRYTPPPKRAGVSKCRRSGDGAGRRGCGRVVGVMEAEAGRERAQHGWFGVGVLQRRP